MKNITISLSLNQVRYVITALKHVSNQYQKEIDCTGAPWAYEGKKEIEDLIDKLNRSTIWSERK